MALMMTWASYGSGPSHIQRRKVSTETASTTSMKMPATVSASTWMGVRLH